MNCINGEQRLKLCQEIKDILLSIEKVEGTSIDFEIDNSVRLLLLYEPRQLEEPPYLFLKSPTHNPILDRITAIDLLISKCHSWFDFNLPLCDLVISHLYASLLQYSNLTLSTSELKSNLNCSDCISPVTIS